MTSVVLFHTMLHVNLSSDSLIIRSRADGTHVNITVNITNPVGGICMRKIETEMNAAVMLGRDWTQANTSTKRIYGADAKVGVYLHDNHIATVWNACDGRDRWTVEVNTRTLSEYPTRTTMSRLRALGADVCTRKGQVMLDGEALCRVSPINHYTRPSMLTGDAGVIVLDEIGGNDL